MIGGYPLQHIMSDETGSKPSLENTEVDPALLDDDAEAEVNLILSLSA